MRRPNYSVVTGVTVVLAAAATVKVAFQGLIPPPNPKIMSWARGEYVRRAEAQDVDWRPPTADTFAEAQRLSRPVIVVIGLPWSQIGRQVDEAFATPEVARALNRGFVAVRIDAAEDPRWISQFLPLQRTHDGFSVGFQAWIFDLKGRLVDFLARIDAKDDLGQANLLDALLRAQGRFADSALGDAIPADEASQRADVQRLLQPSMAELSLANAGPVLAHTLDPTWGGWTVRGLLPARPLAFRFLQLAGQAAAVGPSLRQVLLSPRADWLDGGFYRIARADLRAPEYDKVATANAQLAETLAVQDALRPDPLLRQAARGTVRWIVGLEKSDLVPGAEEGDEDERGRSARASFSPARLREAVAKGTLSQAERDWAEDNLSLRDAARIALPTAEATGDRRLMPVLAGLRAAGGPRRTTLGQGLCDVNGTVAACLLRCARLWDDRTLVDQGGAMVDRLESFRFGPGLRHSLTGTDDTLPFLGDSLAYADAQLEDFLANGRAPSLERGVTELRRALALFGGPEPGILRPSPRGTPLLKNMPELPQVVDDEREALTATALRLLDAYAAVLGPSGRDLAFAANDVQSRLASVTDAIPAMGGALGALARHADGQAAFVVGSEALERASHLARRLPNRLVVPVLGTARPDLSQRPSGVYIASPSGLSGPLSEDEAVRRLSGALEMGG